MVESCKTSKHICIVQNHVICLSYVRLLLTRVSLPTSANSCCNAIIVVTLLISMKPSLKLTVNCNYRHNFPLTTYTGTIAIRQCIICYCLIVDIIYHTNDRLTPALRASWLLIKCFQSLYIRSHFSCPIFSIYISAAMLKGTKGSFILRFTFLGQKVYPTCPRNYFYRLIWCVYTSASNSNCY